MTDFGCGPGGYVKMISDVGIYARGFDGNPKTGELGCNSIDIFLDPVSGPEPCPSHYWSVEMYLNL